MSHNLPHLAVRGIPHVVKEDGRVLWRNYCRNAQALQTLGILLSVEGWRYVEHINVLLFYPCLTVNGIPHVVKEDGRELGLNFVATPKLYRQGHPPK